MKRCGDGCIPCCDFCIHAEHEILYDETLGEDIKGGPIRCKLHNDEEHNMNCEWCRYCKDFHCFRAKENKSD